MFHVLYLSGIEIDQHAAAIVGRMDFFVRVFFVLSAFAIGNAYYDRMNSVEATRSFYAKRFFRIAPLFYFIILAGVVSRLAMSQPMPSTLDFLLSGSFLFTLVPGKQSGLVGGGWSIGLEWLFYALFPLMLVTLRSARSALLTWAVLCTVAVLSHTHYQQNFDGQLREFGLLHILAHAHYFALGFLLLHLVRNHSIQAVGSRHRQLCGVAFVLVLGATLHLLRRPGWLPEEIMLSIAAPVMVALSIMGFPAWLDNRLTRWLGLISYSLYLVQFPVIQLLGMQGVYAGIDRHVDSGPASYIAASAVTVACVVLVSAITYRFIEVPGQNLYQALRRRRRESSGQR